MNLSTDVVIVGGGVMGCGAAYHLAKTGHSVTLLEQYAIGHGRGSSHGPTRIIRLAYDGLDYVQLARAAYAQWYALQAETGGQIIVKNGGLDIGMPDDVHLDGIRNTFYGANVPFDELTRDEIQYRYPQFRLPEGTIGFYQADWSMLSAGLCVTTLAAQATRHGAKIVEGEVVTDLAPSATGVRIRTDKNTYTASKIIIAAGSWSRPLLAKVGLELPLTVLKEQISFFAARDPQEFMPVRLPLVIHHFPNTTSVGSVFPIHNHAGVKLMIDRVTEAVSPDDMDRSIDETRVAQLRKYGASILPGLSNDIIESVSCRYTMSPDEDFIIDTHGDHRNIIVASPCSSHGFKFGIVIGEILADLAIRGSTQHPIQRFSLSRPALRGGAWRNKGSIPIFT